VFGSSVVLAPNGTDLPSYRRTGHRRLFTVSSTLAQVSWDAQVWSWNHTSIPVSPEGMVPERGRKEHRTRMPPLAPSSHLKNTDAFIIKA
jgi:hypothetical protein